MITLKRREESLAFDEWVDSMTEEEKALAQLYDAFRAGWKARDKDIDELFEKPNKIYCAYFDWLDDGESIAKKLVDRINSAKPGELLRLSPEEKTVLETMRIISI